MDYRRQYGRRIKKFTADCGVPDFVDEEEDEEYDVDYKPSPWWVLEKGDSVRTAANK